MIYLAIKQQLQEDLMTAMKAKDIFKRDNLRLIATSIQNMEIELKRDLKDVETIQILKKSVKQIEEEMDLYLTQGNVDKFKSLQDMYNLLMRYIPKQMGETEICMLVEDVIINLKAQGTVVNKGSIMKALMPQINGKADNRVVNEVVTYVLTFPQ